MTPTPYVKLTWIDGDTTKPTSAARLGVHDNGIFDAHYKPCVSVSRSAAQTIATASATVLLFDTEQYDTDAMHSTVTNTGRLTAPVAGKYLIGGTCLFVSSSTGNRQGQFRVNGTTFIADDVEPAPISGQPSVLGLTRPYLLSASDYVEFYVTQTSGGNLNTGSGISDCCFWMHLLAY